MKKVLQTKYLTLICFLLLLSIMFFQSVIPVGEGFEKTITEYQDTGKLNFSPVEETYNNTFEGKNFFITLNGAYQRLMGARVINERYRLDNGHLTYVIAERNVENIAQNTVDFRNALEEQGVPMVYVNTPFKIHPTDKQLPASVQDYSNENADRFLEYLRKENVTVLDLRESIAKNDLDHYDMFYKTDHHWKAEAGLWAAGEIESFLSAMDAGYKDEDAVLDPSNYAYEVHENIFLGTAGKRTGSMYAGKDDFTVITPNFETDLSLSAEYADGKVRREGNFEDVFIVRELLHSDDIFLSNVYSTYCGIGFRQMEIYNHNAETGTQGTSKKLLIIRDSFSDVLIPFLSLNYERLDVLDLRGFTGDLIDYIEKACPDMVLVIYNPGAFEPHNQIMFDFMNHFERVG